MSTSLDELKKRADDLMHRNTKQKEELIKDIITYLEVNNKSNSIDELKKYLLSIYNFTKVFIHQKGTMKNGKKEKETLFYF